MRAGTPRARAGRHAQDVTDGDLCEQFSALPTNAQRAISDELDRSPSEIVKKLEELRSSIL